MSTKQRILDSALRLLQTRSYAGFSFQDVADEVGIRKASIYSHFPSKEALALAALQHTESTFELEVKTWEIHPAKEQFDHLLDWFRRLSVGGERVCPGGSFASTWSSTPPVLQASVIQFINGQLERFERIIVQGLAEGSIQTNGLPTRQWALLLLSNIQGALQMARITGKGRTLDIMIERTKFELFT